VSDSSIGKVMIMILTLAAAALISLSDVRESDKIIVYDCDVAEWHPNVPPKIKEECQKLKFEEPNWRKEQEFPRKNLTIT
jgi:hypothetical protein